MAEITIFDILARLVLIIVSILVITVITKLWKNGRVGKQFFFVIVIFWTIIFIAAVEPSVIIKLRDSTTLDSNAQFLLILSVIIILYLLFVQVRKSKDTSFDLQNVVRQMAVSNFVQNFKTLERVEVLIILCAKNESKNIGKVIDDICSQNFNFSYKILVINDGSSDETAFVARKKGALVIDHVYNLGIGGSIKTGFIVSKLFKPRIVINIDADGQHDPKYIPEIVSEINNNDVDLVYASRFTKESEYDSSVVKLVGNKFYTNLVRRITKVPFTDVTSGYRGIKFNKINLIYFVSEANFAIELAIRGGRNRLKITEIATKAEIRTKGQSQFHRLEKFVVYNFNAFRQIYYAFVKKPSQPINVQNLADQLM